MTIEDVKAKRDFILLSTTKHKIINKNNILNDEATCIVCHKQLAYNNNPIDTCYCCTFSNNIKFYMCLDTISCLQQLKLD